MPPVVRTVLACLLSTGHVVAAEPADTNYDESKVPAYKLPKILIGSHGGPVESKQQWPARREEVLKRLAAIHEVRRSLFEEVIDS